MVRGRSYISEYNLGSLCSSQCNIVINWADPPLIHVIVIILADDHPDDNRHLLDGGLIVGNRPNSTSNGWTLLELVLIWWDLGGYEDMSGDIWGCKDMKFIFIWNPRAFEGNIIFFSIDKNISYSTMTEYQADIILSSATIFLKMGDRASFCARETRTILSIEVPKIWDSVFCF